MNVREWLPRDKHDYEAVRKLSELSNEELRDIIPELMEWLQDGNWPIARSVEDLLLRFGEELIPHIQNVFKTKDPQWEYFMLTGLIRRLPSRYLIVLKVDLERILKNPTEDEMFEELDEVIVPLLEKIQ
ncbi:DUF5071 domain-containing protein [Paenibacillus taichungensis]|uniref:DUF5071 domain-containing protein n=1 Tax=Paenibacillus taichungensis TaxID=484184 RepID=UPI002DBBBA28|nr:DUF5071 domain-containing protein [Paenibacillus taichungensis]MEC0108268.1 DUF5071 domain-containing protein [Paenibacillus taichungensis]MEC0199687.1 DUF5071 domain-containing protein [Paenibacillus taichungensis]